MDIASAESENSGALGCVVNIDPPLNDLDAASLEVPDPELVEDKKTRQSKPASQRCLWAGGPAEG